MSITLNNPRTQAAEPYPRVLYRKTDEEERFVQTTKDDGSPKTWIVVNNYHGRLCDTMTVGSEREEQAMAADGWAISPDEAHGQVSPDRQREMDRDAELVALRAEVARRGPGRPPRAPEPA